MHDAPLLSTIAISLALALVGGWLALQVGMPPLVGYLAAGIVVGPFTPGFEADAQLAPELAEIGVILLLFGVGMHFSIRDLLSVRGVAVPGAIAQIAVATGLGFVLARSWGWSTEAGLVFGLALSVASTVVLLRTLESIGGSRTNDARIAIGWLVVEDLLMVLALVLLPLLAPASTEHPAPGSIWAEVGWTIAKVALFVGTISIVGGRLFPWLLRRVETSGSRELFTLAVITLSIGVAYGSARAFGVSYALGAFCAGVVIHGSGLSHRAAEDLKSFEDAFSALFFVAVGMLFDPSILVREPIRVLAVVAIIVVGKSLAAYGIVLLLRQPSRTALTVSAALAQIGEFSFILAGLGVALNILPLEGQSLILAGALFSILLNPLAYRLVARVAPQPRG